MIKYREFLNYITQSNFFRDGGGFISSLELGQVSCAWFFPLKKAIIQICHAYTSSSLIFLRHYIFSKKKSFKP